MELSKDIKIKKPEENLQKRLEDDFVVKNMPSFSSLSATSYEGEETTNNKHHSSGKRKDKASSSKSVGLIIIAAGILVICALFYLAYRFLIVPSMAPSVTPETISNNQSNQAPVVVPSDSIVEPVINPDTEIVSSTAEVAPVEVIPEESLVEEKDNLVLPTVVDSDGDGLSDAAELFLGTNAQLSDTDNDGYSDFEEIVSGYNPNGAGKLEENNNLALFSNAAGGYAVIYPHDWELNIVSPDSTLFSAPDSSFIQISREDSGQINSDIVNWYQEKFGDVDTLSQDRFIESNFGSGIVSADRQIAYFLGPYARNIYVISYIKSGESAPYMEIFRMMASTLMPL